MAAIAFNAKWRSNGKDLQMQFADHVGSSKCKWNDAGCRGAGCADLTPLRFVDPIEWEFQRTIVPVILFYPLRGNARGNAEKPAAAFRARPKTHGRGHRAA